MAVPLPQIEGKYEILEKLHDGGMGSIYKVRHRLLDAVRVIKTMRPTLADDDQFQARFLREAKVAIKLEHPNIAKLHDFSIAADGTAFIVMEYLPGLSLREILQGMGPPELPLTLEVAHQTLKALAYLHRHGYVHRDISPDNLMLVEDHDGRPLAKLIDLGIAKDLAGGDELTTTGHFLGKARYSSPEHFGKLGAAGTDARSDVYSFGVVLYELLTGQPAIEGNDLQSLSAGHLFRPPLPFAESDPDGNVPEDLRRAVLRALAKRAEDRYSDGEAFAAAIDGARQRLPLRDLDLQRLFERIRATRKAARTYAVSGTQIQLDRQFGQETTPASARFVATDAATETTSRPATAGPSFELQLPPPDTGTATAATAEDTDGGDDGTVSTRVPDDDVAADVDEVERTMVIRVLASETAAGPPADTGTSAAGDAPGLGASTAGGTLIAPLRDLVGEAPAAETDAEDDGRTRLVALEEIGFEATADPGTDAEQEDDGKTRLVFREELRQEPAAALEGLALDRSPRPERPSLASTWLLDAETRREWLDAARREPEPAAESVPPPSIPAPGAPPPRLVSSAPPPAESPPPSPPLPPPLPSAAAPVALDAPPEETGPVLETDAAASGPAVVAARSAAKLLARVGPAAVEARRKLQELLEPALRRRWPLAAAAAVLVGILAAVLLLGRSGRTPDSAETSSGAADAVVEPTPDHLPEAPAEESFPQTIDEIHPGLLTGQRCLAAGDVFCAVVAMETAAARSVSMSPWELDLLADLRTGVDVSLEAREVIDLKALGERLVKALDRGPITALRDAYDALVEPRRRDPKAFAALDRELGQAAEVLATWRDVWRYKSSNDHLDLIREASRLGELYPPYATTAAKHRDEAAATIEAEAERLAAGGDLAGAKARLAELRRSLPDRPGLAERAAALDHRLESSREIEAAIARAEEAAGASRPEDGLAALGQIAVPEGSPYAAEVTRLRDRLQRQLLDMDRAAPTVHQSGEVEYRRNEKVEIRLQIADDYRVERVRAWARGGEEGAFAEVAVRHDSGTTWVVEVPPGVHQNKRNLYFHVWAVDRSGHATTLGTAAEPQAIRRKGLF